MLKKGLKNVKLIIGDRMEKVKHYLGIFLQIVLIIYVILITTLLLYRNKYGYTQFDDLTFVNIDKHNVRTFDDFEKGDLVILRKPYFDEISVGDQLYYYTVQNYKYVIEKANVLKITGDKSGAVYTLDGTDGISVSTERIIGIYEDQSYSNIGFFLNILESSLGFLILVIMPILLIFIYQFYNLVILIKTPEKEIEGKKRTRGRPRKSTTKKVLLEK